MLDVLEPWGLLPLAVPLSVVASSRLAGSLVRSPTFLDHLAATAVTGLALVHVLVGVLGTFGVLTPSLFFASLFLVAGASLGLPPRGPAWSLSRWLVVATALGAIPLAFAAAAARLLPTWRPDALAQLPFVNLVVQEHGFSGLPSAMATSPHAIERGMVALRLVLPDDRLLDLGQLPYGLAGAVFTSAIARRLAAGKEEGVAVLAGALWLFVPAVFLELPTNAVDVGSAAAFLGAVFFLLVAPVGRRTSVLGALSLAIFLGSTSTALLATVVLLAAFAWRTWSRGRTLLLLVVGLTGALGADHLLASAWHGLSRSTTVVDAWSDFFDVKRGLVLPLLLAMPFALLAVWRVMLAARGTNRRPSPAAGTSSNEHDSTNRDLLSVTAASSERDSTARDLLAATASTPPSERDSTARDLSAARTDTSGATEADGAAPRPSLNLFAARANTSTPNAGDGAVGRFVVSDRGAAARHLRLLVALVASVLVAPRPLLGFTALLFALALSALEAMEAPKRVVLITTALAAAQLALSVGSLSGGGPTLSTAWAMTDEARRAAVAPEYAALWKQVQRDEVVAFDDAFEAPSRLFAPRLDYRVLPLPALEGDALTEWARAHHVRFLAVGARSFDALTGGPWRQAFSCHERPCAVFELDEAVVSAR